MFVWILQNLNTSAIHILTAEHLAMSMAERMVGNRAVARSGEILLYGPGDGTANVMIRRMTRQDAAKFFPDENMPPMF